MFTAQAAERRHFPRFNLRKPVKVVCPDTGKTLAGQTHDVSASGAMIELEGNQRLAPGQSVRIGIAWTPRQTLMAESDMIEAQVIRGLGSPDRQHIALKFADGQYVTAEVA